MRPSAGTEKPARKPQSLKVSWWETDPGLPNDSEVLFLALLRLADAASAAEAAEWAAAVLRTSAAGSAESWPPAGPEWKSVGGQPAPLDKPLHRSFKLLKASKARLEPIRLAMKAWRRAGARGDLELHHLQNYIRQEPPGPKPLGSKSKGPPRWRSAGVLDVATLVKKHGPELRKLLRLDVPAEEVLSPVEELELRTEECAELREQREKDKAELVREKAGRRVAATRLQVHVRARRAWKKAQLDLLAARLAAFKAATKEKTAEKLAVLGERQNEQLAKEYEEEVTRLKVATAKARARARGTADDAAASQKRLKRAQVAEQELKVLKRKQAEQAPELVSEPEAEQLPAKEARRDDRGRYEAMPWQARPLVWAQLARRTPPSAINANITDVLSAFAPDSLVPLPCEREVKKMRGELTIAGEALAAFRVAKCPRIISFGFDESTKFGIGLLSTNTQIEPHDAPGTSVDVVMRGVTVSSSGKAVHLAAAIEKDIFSHGRTLLSGWSAQHEKTFGSGSWAAAGGPAPDSIGLHRLSKHAVLVSDTCNGARATKRLVAAHAEAAGREKLGISPEAWEVMSEEERASKCKVCSTASTLHLSPYAGSWHER